jgi:hypothetical protein
MIKPPFFVCLPRTRSSILFETMQYWAEKNYGLLPLHNHTELFLEVSKNSEFFDAKIGTTHEAELYPIAKEDGMHIHYSYPHVFNSGKDRNLHKLSVLKELKKQGKNYNIKGTINIVHTPEEIVNFFNDRHFVITKRHDMVQNIISFLYAYTSKLFHAKHNNLDRYQQIWDQGVTVDEKLLNRIPDYISKVKVLNNIETILKQNNISYDIIYYEDMDTPENINNIIDNLYKTTEWRKHIPEYAKDKWPILLEKDYSQAINNYEIVLEKVKGFLNE